MLEIHIHRFVVGPMLLNKIVQMIVSHINNYTAKSKQLDTCTVIVYGKQTYFAKRGMTAW